jgi:dolichol-phosphate mannosyltransferase
LLPTYNERENIDPIIRAIFAAVPNVHILVIDDNSPDGTADVVRALCGEFENLRLLSRPRKEGLGKAYLDAFGHVLAEGEFEAILTMDADFSHDPCYLPGILGQGAAHDIVIGSRYTHGGGVEGWEFWRRMLSGWANFYCRTITGMPLRDCTAGYMFMRADILRSLDLGGIRMSGYAFLMELKYALWRSGASFAEVPIVFRCRRSGESKISSHIIGEGVFAPWRLRLRGRA